MIKKNSSTEDLLHINLLMTSNANGEGFKFMVSGAGWRSVYVFSGNSMLH